MEQVEEKVDTEVLDLMVDIETLSTEDEAVILSYAFVVFGRYSGRIVSVHYGELDITHQLGEGRRVSTSTQDWWLKTDAEELKRLLNTGDKTLSTLCSHFIDSLDYEVDRIWSRRDLDKRVITHVLGRYAPPYYKWYDVATLDVFGHKMERNNHNALEDCKNQIAYVTEILNGYRRMQQLSEHGTCKG